MTSLLQDHVCFIGQKDVFEEGCQTLKRLMGIEVSGKHIQRVSEYYGQCVEAETEKLIKDDSLSVVEENDLEQITYGMTDGSMLFTKEEGWKEMKLGRVFNDHENIPVSENRNFISESTYCAYLGGHEKFLERFELLIKHAACLIFIADGAKWFWEWASALYPKAIQILDYFHCKEYLCEFAKLFFQDEKEKNKWIANQEKLFFKDKVDTVILNIKACNSTSQEIVSYQKKIITYYENNKSRMKYGTYSKKGYLIGSGPIESAHRNVLQQRLKRSGQRWSKQGLQQIANLRVAHKSNEWKTVTDFIKGAKAAA